MKPTAGSPRDLVLLHGQPGSGSDWALVAGLLPPEVRVTAPDRPGYGANPSTAAGFEANARVVLAGLEERGISGAVLVGHSYAGGVALMAAAIAPDRIGGLVLLASVGPGCLTAWDRLLAAPVTGPVCARSAWSVTPWFARARLARIARRQGRPIAPDEHVNWHVWAYANHDSGPLWRSFLAEQRALVRELPDLVAVVPEVHVPVLLLADPGDTLIPVRSTLGLHSRLPDSRLRLVPGAGHHLPRRAAPLVASAIVDFLAELDEDERG